jgi:dihydroorotase
MKLLIRNARIADPRSALNGKNQDILVTDGVIAKIAEAGQIKDDDAVLFASNCVVSPGWFDMRVNFREPGEEQKETINSGQDAAAAGGFTGVLLMPSVQPPVSSRGSVEYIRSLSREHVTDVFPAGTITDKREGKELAEIFDMQQGGAVMFTDDKRFLQNSGLMLRALQYAGNVNARLISYADDVSLSGASLANESGGTTALGFKGSPAIAEVIAVERDLSLVRYTGQPLHFAGISSREALEAIRIAKLEGLPVTAEVFIHHLLFDDSMLNEFDANYKVKPPLRSMTDVEVLREGVIDGTIDVVSSDHSPQDIESKDVEFDYAAFGMSSVETLYSSLRMAFGDALTEERLAEVLSLAPRRIAGVTTEPIETGARANMTVFQPEAKWIFTMQNSKSRGVNSPLFDRELPGVVTGVINGRFSAGR